MGHKPIPEGPVHFGGHGHGTWDELDAADIETMTLPQFMEKMAEQYEDWHEFMKWVGYNGRSTTGEVN